MKYQPTQLWFLSYLLNELAPVPLVHPIGVCSRTIVNDRTRTHQHHARVERSLWVLEHGHVSPLDAGGLCVS